MQHSMMARAVTKITDALNPSATNYDASKEYDDGSCVGYDLELETPEAFAVEDVYGVGGCTDSTATNHNPVAVYNDGSCDYSNYGCTEPVCD